LTRDEMCDAAPIMLDATVRLCRNFKNYRLIPKKVKNKVRMVASAQRPKRFKFLFHLEKHGTTPL
jgi:hypothetical protein